MYVGIAAEYVIALIEVAEVDDGLFGVCQYHSSGIGT